MIHRANADFWDDYRILPARGVSALADRASARPPRSKNLATIVLDMRHVARYGPG